MSPRSTVPAIFLIVFLCADVAAAQTTPLAALQEQAGWRALDAGQTDVAAIAFRDALASDPNNVRLYFGVATAAFLRRRDDEAKAALERALTINAQYNDARELLGRVLYRSGDLRGAIDAFEMLAGGDRGERLAATLAGWRREAELHDRMHLTGGSGFTVAFEGPEEAGLAEHAVMALEAAALRIGTILGQYPAGPVRVVLYTREQFRDITRSPSWAGGSFDGIIRVPIGGSHANLKELDRVLAHEYTHALIADFARTGVPTWFNEGLAVALENPTTDTAGQHNDPSQYLPLARLAKPFRELPPEAAVAAYATSGAAVRRLLDEAGGTSLVSVLRDVGQGAAFEAAFERWMGRSLAEFSASLPGQ